jgi:hypothetical protein|tara:strand:- start:675 stop:971 length:297 start_codon:yes stop_codon:yes gene_type:complete
VRVEIDVVLFFSNKPMKKINGFLKVSDGADDDDVLDEMAGFIEKITEEYMTEFTTGVANLILRGDELFQVSFANPKKQPGTEGKNLCNIIIPDEIIVH